MYKKHFDEREIIISMRRVPPQRHAMLKNAEFTYSLLDLLLISIS